jgi:hypothetical protein
MRRGELSAVAERIDEWPGTSHQSAMIAQESVQPLSLDIAEKYPLPAHLRTGHARE